jgi:hypothetical protein
MFRVSADYRGTEPEREREREGLLNDKKTKNWFRASESQRGRERVRDCACVWAFRV